MRGRLLCPLLLVTLLLFPGTAGAEIPEEGYCDEEGNPVVISWPPGGPDAWDAFCVGGNLVFDHPGFDATPAEDGGFQYPQPEDWAGWASVRVNGWVVINPYSDVLPYVTSTTGRTLVPIRYVSEAIGAKVEWNGETQTVRISWRDRVIQLPVGQAEALVNNQVVTLDQPAILFENRTFVPLRFIGEAFGAQVGWDDSAWVASLYLEGAECNPEYCR